MYIFFPEYAYLKWPVVEVKHIKIKPRVYILSVLELDDEASSLITNKY